MALPKADLADLEAAKALLEHQSMAAKLARVIGSPIERGLKQLPSRVQAGVHKATEKALMKALDVAVSSLRAKGAARPSRDKAHKRARARAPHRAHRIALRRGRVGESRRPGDSHPGGGGRRAHQHDLHRALPGPRARPLHRAPPGKDPRRTNGAARLGTDPSLVRPGTDPSFQGKEHKGQITNEGSVPRRRRRRAGG